MKLISRDDLVKFYEDAQNREWEKAEKILLTVTSGTLAFSVAFFTGSENIFFHTFG